MKIRIPAVMLLAAALCAPAAQALKLEPRVLADGNVQVGDIVIAGYTGW